MTNEILEALANKLTLTFGDGIEVLYEEEAMPERPGFFIMALRMEQEQHMGNRALRNQPFDIRYYPVVLGSYIEMYTIAENLFDAFETLRIEEDSVIRGTKMSYQVLDGVLHFYVNYDMVVTDAKNPEDTMENLEIHEQVKG